MATRDPNVFEEHLLRFSLKKPGSWDFIPAAWSPVAQLRNSNNEDWQWLRQANQPFCCARKLHDCSYHAYPTLQVTVRRSGVPTNAEAKALLEAQLDFLSKQYPDLDPLHATPDALLSGHRANIIRARFTLFANIEGDEVALPILSRAHVIFSPGRAFTFGMSSSTDKEYFDESDFDEIISSVRIGG